MKKTALTLLVLIVVGIVVFFYYGYPKNRSNPVNLEVASKENSGVLTKEIKIGNMVLIIPDNLTTKEEDGLLSIEIPGVYKNISKPNYTAPNLEMDIHYLKAANESKLSLEDWFADNDPMSGKTSATYEYTEPKVVNGITYLESLYKAPTLYSSDFYDVVFNYFGNKRDIYNVVFYKKSENEKIELTEEQIKSIENYEKVVNEILQSIKFVD